MWRCVIIIFKILIVATASGNEAEGLDASPLKSLSAAERSEAGQARDRADLMRSELERHLPRPAFSSNGDGRRLLDLRELEAEAAEVARAYQEVIERYPRTDISAYCATRLAGFYQRLGQVDDAANVLEGVADEFAGTAEGHKATFETGLVHSQARQDPREAIQWFARVPEPANRSDAEALALYLSAQQQLMKCELALGRDGQAKERLSEMKAAYPQFASELENFFQFEVTARNSQPANKPAPIEGEPSTSRSWIIWAVNAAFVFGLLIFVLWKVMKGTP